MSYSALELTERLCSLLAKHSVRRGNFVLTSGAHSPHYVDARLTTMRPEGLTTIAQLALLRFPELLWFPTAVGGLTLGADPIAYAIAYASSFTPTPLRAFTVRKEPKAHGTHQQIEGPLIQGDAVVIIEDVLTTGGSALRAVEAVQKFGASVLGVLAVVDRQEGGIEKLASAGLKASALTQLSEILAAT